jgi:hypothetical protein
VADPQSNLDPLSDLPDPQQVRERLAVNARERVHLRSLLRLSERVRRTRDSSHQPKGVQPCRA